MSIIYLGVGVAAGVAISFYFQQKISPAESKGDNQTEALLNQNRRLKSKLSEADSELQTAKNSLKKMRDERDSFLDKSEDFETDINKLKKVNSDLAAEIEKLRAEIYEYEMLYSASKVEITELKERLNNG